MTDKEIIKALECCVVMYDCPDCPFECDCGNMGNLSTAAIDLINRLKEANVKNENIIRFAEKTIEKQGAEIERYLHSIKLLEKDVQTAKSEAIKEFAEKVDKILCLQIGPSKRAFWKITEDIKNLVKEMVGDDNA